MDNLKKRFCYFAPLAVVLDACVYALCKTSPNPGENEKVGYEDWTLYYEE